MRRLLVPAALLAALVAFLLLSPAWQERAESRRATRAEREDVAPADATPAAAGGADARAPEGMDPALAQARVRGVVTGNMGVFFGARVVAYRPLSDDVLARTYTNPEGEYALDLAAPLDFDLAVEPAPETYLAPVRRRGLVLNAGDDLEENFALGPTAAIVGRLVDVEGRGIRVEVLAVRPEDMPDPWAHPNAVSGREKGRCRSGADGAFRLGCLEPGAYAIVVRDPEWTLEKPAVMATDRPGLALTAVPAISVDLDVRDMETEEPVERFSVKLSVKERQFSRENIRVLDAVPQESRVLLEARGSDGVFATRVPCGPRPRFPFYPDLEVTAKGFLPWGPGGATSRSRLTVWLMPEREPNTVVRVFFDDGKPYRGDLAAVHFKARSGDAAGSVALERVEDGVFRGAMPRGRWGLTLWLRGLFGDPRRDADADVTAGRDAVVNLTLPAGGTLVLLPPAGTAPTPDGDPALATAYVRGEAEIERNSDGRAFQIWPAGARIEGVPPGLYQIGYEKWQRIDDFHAREIVWFRDVRVAAGGEEEIRLPSR